MFTANLRRWLAIGVVLLVLATVQVEYGDHAAYAAESISYDFNTAGDLSSDFNGYSSSGTISQSSSGGIGNSGAIQVDTSSPANAVYATKDGYSLGPVGSTYTFTAQMRSAANSGYSGMGFSSLVPGSGTTGGSPFHPNDAIGVSVHGGGYVFHNGTTNVFGSWNVSYSGANDLWTISTDAGGIQTYCSDATQDTCWYKVLFKITRDTSSTFDARVELYGSSQSGTLDSPTPLAVIEFRDQVNTTLTNANLLYSYINFSGQRMRYFDDFEVSLAGGASVISAGSPVILTSSASQSAGVVTVSGNVTSDGGASVTERGFVYGTSSNPTTSSSKVTSGSGTGTFSASTSSLSPGTYYFRAYATNSVGTSYGSQETVVVVGPPEVTFDANGGSGSMSNQSASGSTALTTNTFTRAEYSFQGWNTDEFGLGDQYSDGASFPFTADDTLYAQWHKTEPPITTVHDTWVTYNASTNHSTSTGLVVKTGTGRQGTTRVAFVRFDYDPDYSWPSAALELTVSGNTPGADASDYFGSFNLEVYGANDAGWDESTLEYPDADGSSEDWAINANGGPWDVPGAESLGQLSVPRNTVTVPGTCSNSSECPTLGQTYSLANQDLRDFLNNDADGKVTFVIMRTDPSAQANLTFASSENGTYDGPRLVVPSGSFSYPVAYDLNDSSASGSVPDQGAFTPGTPYTIAGPSNVTPPTGKTFSGWNSKSDGSGISYAVGSSYSTAASLALFAQYTSNPVVTFNSNDGNSVSVYQTVTSGSPAVLSSNTFSRSGFSFSGWNTAPDGSGVAYANSASVTISSSLALYAQWAAITSGSSSGGGSASSRSLDPITPRATTSLPARILAIPNPSPMPVALTGPVAAPGRGFDPTAGTRATVGGAPATLQRLTFPGGVSIQAGAFQFGVTLSNPLADSIAGDEAELTLQGGESAQVAGSGMLPGSPVQIWLPGRNGKGPRELGWATVGDDGTVQTELVFAPKQSEAPLAIGPQVLQVTGYDENGNLTVVDLPVNVAQGPVVPEPNMEVGELPTLRPGLSLATSAGLPTQVSVTASPNKRSVVVGDGSWEIAVDVDGDRGVIDGEAQAPTISLENSAVASARGDGFQPGTTASVWIFSDPTLMATVVVSTDGSFIADFMVDPRFLPPGEHTLQIQGVGEDGFIKAANLGVVVQEPVALTADSAGGMLWWVVGAFIVAIFVVILLLARRRRSS